MFGAADEDEDDSLDKDEAVLSVWGEPRHPSLMKPPLVYKLCLLGSHGAGKSSIANRLVAHTFDASYRPTRAPEQLFWRHTEEASGKDIMIEIEDTPGVDADTTPSRELKPDGVKKVEQLLKPLMWFERRRRDRDDGGRGGRAQDESQPLLPGAKHAAAPRYETAVGGAKMKRGSTGLAGLSKAAGALRDDVVASVGTTLHGAFGGSAPQRTNPIGEDRKRMGFVVVADLSSRESFHTAHAIVDLIFDRLQFDQSDRMTCPASIMIVGNKSDLRSGQRAMEPEPELRSEILARYENQRAFPPHNVLYCECSAQTNTGLEQVRTPAAPYRWLAMCASYLPCPALLTHCFPRAISWHCAHRSSWTPLNGSGACRSGRTYVPHVCALRVILPNGRRLCLHDVHGASSWRIGVRSSTAGY